MHEHFFANARPEPDLRYFSTANACFCVTERDKGLQSPRPNLEVCGTSPAFCFANRAGTSSAIPT